MSKFINPKWSETQQEVIDCNNQKLLVSASAGSGKTSVMVERVSRLIQQGIKLNEILMLTFTNLSAEQMREKLEKSLINCLDANSQPQKEVLDQIALSNICTIDTFCIKLVRQNFEALLITPSFSILDKNENKAEFLKICNKVVESFLISDELFVEVYDAYFNSKQDNFCEFAFKFLNFALAEKNKDGYLEQCLNLYQNDSLLLKLHCENLNYKVGLIKNDFDALLVKAQKYNMVQFENKVGYYIAMLAGIKNAKTFNAKIQAISEVQLANFSVKDSPKVSENKEDVKAVLSLGKNIFKNLQAFCESYNGINLAVEIKKLKSLLPYAKKLIEVICAINTASDEFKFKNQCFYFNDLEQMALKLLDNADILKQISNEYKYIFVDEYQDTNYLQDSIIQKIAETNKLFLVGDIKQSIYGFRQTKPEIFLEKYYKYPKTKNCKVFELNKNYRSQGTVIDPINLIFNNLMTENFGGIDYEKSSQLIRGVSFENQTKLEAFKVLLVDKPEKVQQNNELPYSVKTDTGSNEIVKEFEGRLVAEKILELYNKPITVMEGGSVITRPIAFADIAILYTTRDGAKTVLSELEKVGIPLDCDVQLNSNDYSESDLIIDLLKVVLNPENDILLSGILLSFFGKLNETELLEIKKTTADNCNSFYTTACGYASGSNNSIAQKLTTFFKLLDHFQNLAQFLPVCELMEEVIVKTNFQNHLLMQECGIQRLETLKLFIASLAGKTFAYNLAVFIDSVESGILEQAFAKIKSKKDSVQCKTIHQSKGLEFKIVFLISLEQQFVVDRDKFALSSEFGIGIKSLDVKNRSLYNNLVFSYIKESNGLDNKEERLRLFYIALTRAQNHLYLTGVSKSGGFGEKAKYPCEASSFLDFLHYAVEREPKLLDQVIVNDISPQIDEHNCVPAFMPPLSEFAVPLERVLNFTYPHKGACGLGLKYSVTEVVKLDQNKTFGEEADQNVVDLFGSDWCENGTVNENCNSSTKPFATNALCGSGGLGADGQKNQTLNEKSAFAKSSSQNNGIAYHKVMEHINFGINSVAEVEGEFDRMVGEDIIESQSISQVDSLEIFQALNAIKPLIKHSTSHKRECKFMLFMQACEILDTTFTDKILVQGVIDLIIFGNKNIVIDFKKSNSSESTIKQRYKKQLQLYKVGCKKAINVDIDETYIYVFDSNKLIKIE